MMGRKPLAKASAEDKRIQAAFDEFVKARRDEIPPLRKPGDPRNSLRSIIMGKMWHRFWKQYRGRHKRG